MSKVLHQHEVATFLRCSKKYEYATVRNWESMQKPEKMMLGSYFHEEMRLEATGELQPVDWRVEIDPIESQAADIAHRYLQYVGMPPKESIISAEESFLVETGMTRYDYDGSRKFYDFMLPDAQVMISFKPDLLYREGDDIICRDYKTMARLPGPDDRGADEMDFQLNMYLWGLSKRFPDKRVYFEYEFVRTAIPRDPDITEEGKVSRTKIITSKERYMDALEKNGQGVLPESWGWMTPNPPKGSPVLYVPNEYKKVIDELPWEKDFFARSPRFYKTPQELAAFGREVEKAVEDILSHEERNSFSRSVIKTGGEACEQCLFFVPCKRELYGDRLSDVEMGLLGYRQREEEAYAQEDLVG